MLDFKAFTAVTTIGDLLLRTAAALPDKDGLVFPDRRRTFADLAAGAVERARGLRALGVGPGDHVGILLPSSIDCVETIFAIALLGAVSVPVNARYRSHELRYLTENADLVALVTQGRVAEQVDFVARLTEAFPALGHAAPDAPVHLPEAPRLRHLILTDAATAPGFVSAAAFAAAAAGVAPAEVDRLRRAVRVRDTGVILYTSGTTSQPKGCLISHEALIRTGQALALRYGMTDRDVFWSPLPMFHIGAIFPLCAAWSVGSTYLSMQYFDAGTALEMIERERATITYPSFGTFIADMIYHPDFERRDLSSVRLMNGNMAMQPVPMREALREKMPNAVQVGTYGMTETAGTVTTSFPTDDYRARTERLGKPFDGLEVRIVAADGRVCGPDEIGEITVRGFSLLTGYYKDPVKTAEALRDGWFHTGDLGALDAEGSLMFHGRLKDMLKVGGENVAAQEIEALVGTHPAVKLCQVVGRPDARLAEVPVAFVELRPGATATADELIGFCKGRIASFKVPRDVRFVAEWPMSASKIQKFRLKAMLTGE
mgnify:CR=1 FL=1